MVVTFMFSTYLFIYFSEKWKHQTCTVFECLFGGVQKNLVLDQFCNCDNILPPGGAAEQRSGACGEGPSGEQIDSGRHDDGEQDVMDQRTARAADTRQ